MHTLTKLFQLLQFTRSQPQYGYVLSGIHAGELSSLAAHHYLVTFIGWQLARFVQQQGAAITVERVLEYCLLHDLGELFGGDISMPYGRVNPRARTKAKAFEQENQLFLSRFFGKDKKYFYTLSKEILGYGKESDENIIAKLADYIEATQYKIYVRAFAQSDITLAETIMKKKIKKIKDAIAKKELTTFVNDWLASLPKLSKTNPVDLLQNR